MDTIEIFRQIQDAIDKIIETSELYGGLFPSILDPQTGKMFLNRPPKITGQRNGDRSHLGSNLIHDEPLLQTMYALGRPKYIEAADKYLSYFSLHCTKTSTGLFPWGEHSFWHLIEKHVGCSRNSNGYAIHDHLRHVPFWLWDKLRKFNPDCIQNFADGLSFHWTKGSGYEYIRHANIEIRSQLERGARSCDFPRHSGFYICDLAYAYVHMQRTEIFDQLCLMTEYWWNKRDELGLLLIESRSPKDSERFFANNTPSQTLSLGASLLESADLIKPFENDLALKMQSYAYEYISGFLAAPHEPLNRKFVSLCQRETQKVIELMITWGSIYGASTVSGTAVLCINVWRLTQNKELLKWALAAGESYLEEPFPIDKIKTKGLQIPAMDSGLVLALFSDLYDVTGESGWLAAGMDLAVDICDVYFENTLPIGASNINWYESQLGPAFLIHGLARLASLVQDDFIIEPNYTLR